MGGVPPLGYRVENHKLVIVDSEAEIVREIFCRYAELGSVRLLKEEFDARRIKSKSWTSTSGRLRGGKPFSRGALYLILQNRTYRGEIVHNGRSHRSKHPPIIDQPLWDTVQAQLAGNTAQCNSATRIRQPSLLTGMLFDADGNRMTPTHAVKEGTRYRYYVSPPLITKDRSEGSTGLRLPAEAIEQVVTGRVRQWLLDPGSIYPVTPRSDPSAPRRLIARAAEIGKSWPQLPTTHQRALLAGLVERIDISANQIDMHLRARGLSALFDGPGAPSVDEANDETQILSVPVRRSPSGREIRMLIDRADPFCTAKPDARLIKLLIKAHRFNATLVGTGGTSFAALAKQDGVSPSYFTRLVRLSYLAPDIMQAILVGRQPSHLTADKLLAHSCLPLSWQDQRTLLGFA